MSESPARRRLALRAILVSYRAGCRHPELSATSRAEMRVRALTMLDRLDGLDDEEYAGRVADTRREIEAGDPVSVADRHETAAG